MRKNYLLVLVKLVNHSVMKSHQETLFSEQENSNKWNLNSSVNLAKKLSGKIIGKLFASEWLTDLNISEDNMRLRDHDEDELSHYSNATTDIEYKFPFGWGELWGIASRTDYDLRQHSEHSGEDFKYHDPETNEKYIPYCIEPSRADRVTLAFYVTRMLKKVLKVVKMHVQLCTSTLL